MQSIDQRTQMPLQKQSRFLRIQCHNRCRITTRNGYGRTHHHGQKTKGMSLLPHTWTRATGRNTILTLQLPFRQRSTQELHERDHLGKFHRHLRRGAQSRILLQRIGILRSHRHRRRGMHSGGHQGHGIHAIRARIGRTSKGGRDFPQNGKFDTTQGNILAIRRISRRTIANSWWKFRWRVHFRNIPTRCQHYLCQPCHFSQFRTPIVQHDHGHTRNILILLQHDHHGNAQNRSFCILSSQNIWYPNRRSIHGKGTGLSCPHHIQRGKS
mmetsp:Transcript_499/g.801  ORF Transcript_499/g.801 Transcript_499/m.801 type:complete len:269 (-) Transcript_499:71-877(-)